MKKISYAILLFLLMLFPLFVEAKTYQPSGTDLSISIDDYTWYVFTRDNIRNNPELKEIGLTYEEMNTNMKSNDLYLDAILFDENDNNETLELLIKLVDLDDEAGNLHTYSDKEINEIGKEMVKTFKAMEFDIDDFKVYKNKYKFLEFEWQYDGYNFYYFFTTINGQGYGFTVQKINAITHSDKITIKNIIDSISFDIDEYYETPFGSENESSSNESEQSLKSDNDSSSDKDKHFFNFDNEIIFNNIIDRVIIFIVLLLLIVIKKMKLVNKLIR